MTGGRRALVGVLAVALLSGACGDDGPSTSPPSPSGDAADASPTAASTDRPFVAAAWPAAGSACDLAGYTGRLGRIETVNARTVRFTLCAPDGAFPARLAHPALGIVDASSIDRLAADPAAGRLVAGAGTFRVREWDAGDNVQLVRVGSEADRAAGAVSPGAVSPGAVSPGAASPGAASPGASPSSASASPPPVIILRWAASSAERSAALRAAVVDGIDDPSPSDAATLETIPELVVLPREGLATAYLGFGAGKPFGSAAIRRAFAQGVDAAALARDAFPPGAVAATHTAPCEVTGGCAGADWYEANGPAGAAALAAAAYDARTVIKLHVPDVPVPGLPDPGAAGRAVRDQLAESLGVSVELDVVPAAELRAGIEAGDVEGLYLWGVASSLADASGFLDPLFAEGAPGTPAGRAKGVADALATADAAVEPGARASAFAVANDAIRASAAIVPLVHPGSAAAYRADVQGLALSPLGADPLGDLRPGDRRQLVVTQAAAPGGAWCGVAPDTGSLRLCALVTPGLYAFEGGVLDPQPSLARCTSSDDARTWTCRLREGLAFTDGMRLDAGDVLASFQALADAGGPLRAAYPAAAFAAWDGLFGGPVPADGAEP